MAMNRDECFKQEQKTAGRKKRVAAYCRVSTDREDQANSFESQCAFFRQYIERNAGWELYEIFAEIKLAYLIQRIGTEYLKNRRNKGFRHIWRDRKPFSFYDSSYSDMKQK